MNKKFVRLLELIIQMLHEIERDRIKITKKFNKELKYNVK